MPPGPLPSPAHPDKHAPQINIRNIATDRIPAFSLRDHPDPLSHHAPHTHDPQTTQWPQETPFLFARRCPSATVASRTFDQLSPIVKHPPYRG
jgi:hypothetical protein